MSKAEWLDDSTKRTTFKCSHCGEEPMYKPVHDEKAYICLTPYCPHCGCKMGYDEEKLYKEKAK